MKRTKAHFLKIRREFPSSKEAFVFLIDSFLANRPQLLDKIDWQYQYVAKGRGRLYFARDPKQLFDSSPHLADDSNNYAKTTGGWFANTNLSNSEKESVLHRLAALGGWKYGTDWSFEVVEPGEPKRLSLDDLNL